MTLLQRMESSAFPLVGPPDFPVEAYLERLTHPYMAENSRRGREFRYEVCRMNPILFALHYLRPHLELTQDDGRIVHALSELHVDLASLARRWAARYIGPKDVRDIWVAPRYAGKSGWLFLALPLWALAFGHLEFVVIYSDTVDQARTHFKTLTAELLNNERLRRDFPELCEPARKHGSKVMDNADGYLAAGGAAVMVKGMNSATLGVKLGRRRPDGLFFDDIEPKKGSYSAEIKAKRLEDLIDAILPCNFEAVVQVVGTTVMHGSIIHDAIEGEPWVAAERFEVHHYLGIVTDPVTGEERSMWPAKWPLSFLCAERLANPRGYAKNFDNSPINANGTYWRAEHITYDDLAGYISDRILVIDPATKSTKKNDETAIGKIAYSRDLERVVVEDVVGVRLQPDQLRERVHATCRLHNIRAILVDVTNGGDHVLGTLQPFPPDLAHVRVFDVNIRRGRRGMVTGKEDRIAELHDRYLRQPPQVVHAKPISTLEAQQLSYPNVMHDDQIDVVALGAQYFIDGLEQVGR